MTARDHIRNPVEWVADQVAVGSEAVARASRSVRRSSAEVTLPEVRRIEITDLRDVLARGLADFAAYRSDVIFLCVIYPLAGLVLAWLTFGYNALPLLFPLASGFALLGPVAAVGLYEISRRREQGAEVTWADAFGVVRSPAFGAILLLGLILLLIFLLWMGTAWLIYQGTLGPEPPASAGAFVRAVLSTGAGWTMTVIGCGVGFVFAAVVLSLSVVSFPMLLDRDPGLIPAITTSLRAVAANPGPMAAWGLIVTAGLVLGSVPLLLGLVVVMPVLGHATWHLYRRIVAT
jgi:uncharacterized membrane protein